LPAFGSAFVGEPALAEQAARRPAAIVAATDELK
jgi:hypothetical protein